MKRKEKGVQEERERLSGEDRRRWGEGGEGEEREFLSEGVV